MARDFDSLGNPETRYTPPVGRVHPKDGSLVHYRTTRYAKLGKGGEVRDIVLRGEAGDDRPCTSWGLTAGDVLDEQIRKRRETHVKSRSKLAAASSSSKTQRFIPTNRDIDSRLDNPVQHTLAPREWVATKQTRRTSLRSMAHR